jgi:hypothetical protein
MINMTDIENLKNNKPFLITLQDIDGKIVGSTNYKIANGALLSIDAKAYPSISFASNMNTSVKPATLLVTTDKYRDRLGDVSYAGYGRPQITIDGYIPVITDTDTQARYFGTTYSSTDIIPLNFYLLFNLHLLNHRVYLKDIHPNKKAACADWSTPINILQNRTDIFNNQIFDLAKGVPVIVRDFSLGDIIYTRDGDNEEMSQNIKITLELD